MTTIDAKTVMKLRRETGAPMMECKRALAEAGGDWEKAKEALRIAGLQSADKKASRETSEGMVFSYIHAGNKLGVLLEINCETDFVARNEEFQNFGHELCLHLAFAKPPYLSREDVPAEDLEKERSFLLEQIRQTAGDKPAEIQEKMVEGRMKKFFAEKCFLEQPFVKDDKITIEEFRKQMVAKIGENLVIRRYAVFNVDD